MRIRRKQVSAEHRGKHCRANLFERLEGPLGQGQSEVAQALSEAGREVRLAIDQARAAVAEAESALSTGTRDFKEAADMCSAASAAASETAARSAVSSEAAARLAISTMLESLQQVSERRSRPSAGASAATVP